MGYIAGPKFNLKAEKSEVIYITEHEFLNQVVNYREKFLEVFEVFLIDEAHELRKTTLIILAILRNFIRSRKSSVHKLIVTSATLDTLVFQKYLDGMNVATIEAKTPTYDVQEVYTLFPDLKTNIIENTAAHLRAMMEHLKNHFSTEHDLPNILVFLPSIKEIKAVKQYIEDDQDKVFALIQESLPFVLQEMHGGLKPSEKNLVMKPHWELKKKVRIILATKIAETALTIDDVRYVLDSGLHTEYYFDEITKMDYNKQVPISKSSAIQRKGRAGRTSKGFCFKMYTELEEREFDDTNEPEILRMDIADVIMTQIELVNSFNLSDLLFYEKLMKKQDGSPSNKISQVINELYRIQAIETKSDGESKTSLTNKGRFMIQMGMKGMTAAFLYECIRYGIRDLGEASATVLNNKNIFRNNVD